MPGSTLVGQILDPIGAVVPGTRVTLVNEYTGLEQVVFSGDEGEYRFQSLEAGTYTLTAEQPGFRKKIINGITLDGNSQATINPALEIGSIEKTEVVMGDVAMPEPSIPLVKAAMDNDLAAIKELMSAGANVNAVDEIYQATALSLAVSKGNLEMAQLLLWDGADVNAITSRGHTALMSLSWNSTPEVARALITAGAKIDLQDEDGDTALLLVALDGNPEVLQALLDAGAAVNAQNKKGQTALMQAAKQGVIGNVKALIAAGADIYERDEEGSTALKYARENNRPDVVKLLRTYGAIEYGAY
jgi:ankyrin repeat protein